MAPTLSFVLLCAVSVHLACSEIAPLTRKAPQFSRLMDLLQAAKSNQICPDKSQCGGTCCKEGHGYGCCPYEHGVCCSDQLHCCPSGTVCDVAHSRCMKGETNFIPDVPTVPRYEVQNCPDASPCNATCCKIGQSAYGCCPLIDAVCCPDMLHCCPAGSVCDASAGTCRRREELSDGNLLITESGFQELRVKPVEQVAKDNQICPDHSQCNGTCCKMGSGYGCCPLPHAVCCPDKLHCCPSGTTCTSSGMCQKRENVDETVITVETKQHNLKGADVNEVCPDKSQCNGTCCKESSGAYGCCPYRSGVCCSDQLHCCPNGFTCDVAQSTCVRKEESDSGVILVESGLQEFYKVESNQICPDHSNCSGTCCKTGTGYGCCPITKAVCCADQKHCCPADTTCDAQTGSCRHRGAPFSVTPFYPIAANVNDIQQTYGNLFVV